MKTENSKENHIDINNNNDNNATPFKKDLFIFDFDHTIIEGNTYFEMLNLIPNWSQERHNDMRIKAGNWFNFCEDISKLLIKENISAEKIKENFKALNYVENFADLFNYFRTNKHKYDIMVVSGTFKIFVKWILEQKSVDDLVSEIYATDSEIENNFMKFVFPDLLKRCPDCQFTICKKRYMNFIDLKKYEKIHYAGDGNNDYCPMLVLGEKDYVYPRKGFELHQKLFEGGYNKKINSNVISWENAKEILDNLLKLKIE